MRLVIVSHTYCAPINRPKLAALAGLAALTVIVPARWRDALFTLTTASADLDGYRLRAVPAFLDGRVHYYGLEPGRLQAELRAARPEVVLAEAEPGSVALAQAAWYKARLGYRLTAFTWENLPGRRGLAGLYGWTLRRLDGLIAGNQAALAQVRAAGFRGPAAVIPQVGIDAEQFAPAAEQPARPFTVGFIGRLVAEKGLWVLLQALADLPAARGILIGSGPLQPAVQAWLTAHGLTERIHLAGAVPHAAVPARLRELDVLVLPSLAGRRWTEQFGHVLIEAMASGVPVVGSDAGAIPEVIGPAGLVTPAGDAAALRTALERLQADPALRLNLAAAGRARVLAHYTHARIAAAQAAFLEEVRTCA